MFQCCFTILVIREVTDTNNERKVKKAHICTIEVVENVWYAKFLGMFMKATTKSDLQRIIATVFLKIIHPMAGMLCVGVYYFCLLPFS